MVKRRRLIVFSIVLNALLFYTSAFIFRTNTQALSLAATLLQSAGAIFSIFGLSFAYRKTKHTQRKFWLILILGFCVYLLANLFWVIYDVLEGSMINSDIAYSLWLISYLFFLSALSYRIKKSIKIAFNHYYLFNMLVFMITIASIMGHYLIAPVLALQDNSLLTKAVSIGYPMVNLSILFAVVILYYLLQKNKEKSTGMLIVIGFFMYIASDSYYAYLVMSERYHPGNSVNLTWAIGIWLVGFSGYYVTETINNQPLHVKKPLENKEGILPYISTILLLYLVVDSYQWDLNFLSIGALIIGGMIISRQLYIMKENNKLIDEFRFLAYHDPLTGLKNRIKFIENLDYEMNKSQDKEVTLLLIDLDRFKIINDTLGHQVGDEILVKISSRLRASLEEDMQIFRLGGDEFAIILNNVMQNKSEKMVKVILENVQKPFFVNNHEITLTASMGVSTYPKNGKTVEELFKYADAAMYLAKDNGKNGFRFYDDELSEIMARKMRIESDLRKALEYNQFDLHYQPKVELHTRRIIGMEALLRWNHPELGSISPVEFIPIAEETGQIIPIGEWAMKKACIQNKLWQDKELPPLRVAVNVSVKQFQHGKLMDSVKGALLKSGLHPDYLEIEVTESVMQDKIESAKIMDDLREMGVHISIDDFGTGYSSLTVIQQLPIDTIKLDKSFIDDIGNKNQLAMVKTILSLGENLGLHVVAEGIETDYQLIKLLESNCKFGQGYLFSKPLKADQFETLLQNSLAKDVQPITLP